MPVSPTAALIAFNKYKVKIAHNNLNDEEVSLLNYLTAYNAINNIYGSEPFSNAAINLFSEALKKDKEFKYGYLQKTNVNKPLLKINKDTVKELKILKLIDNQISILDYENALTLFEQSVIRSKDTKSITVTKSMSMSELYCATRAEEVDQIKI